MERKRRRAPPNAEWIRAENEPLSDTELLVEQSDESWAESDLLDDDDDEESGDDESMLEDEESDDDDTDDRAFRQVTALSRQTSRETVAQRGQHQLAQPQSIRGFEEDTDASDTELEEELFGIQPDKRTARRREKRRRRRKTPLFSKSLKDMSKPKRRSAALPSVMNEEARNLYQKAQDLYLDINIEGQKEREAQAIKLLEQCIAMAPGAHDPLQLLANIYESSNEKNKALVSYFLAALYVKTDLEAWKKVGDFAYELMDDDTAMYCYRRVCPFNRNALECDPDVCYKLAEIFYRRLDFVRAARYFGKILHHYPGDGHIISEAAKAYYQTHQFDKALQMLQVGAAASLPRPQRDALFGSILKDNEFYLLLPDTDLPIDWGVIELLVGVCMEHSMWAEAERIVCQTVAFKCPSETLPLGTAVRLAACMIRLRRLASGEPLATIARSGADQVKSAAHGATEALAAASAQSDFMITEAERDKVIGNVWSRLTQDEFVVASATPKLFIVLADAYLEAGDPARALTCYKLIESSMSHHQNSDFWLRVAKCHIQLQDFEQAALFLESVIPRGRHATPNVEERVRDLEARLLLFEVLAHLEDQTADGSPETLSGRRRDILTDFNDSVTAVTMDNRLHQLEVGSNLAPIPEPISNDLRQILITRLSVSLKLLGRAAVEVECLNMAEDWVRKSGIDALPRPTVNINTVVALLPPMLRALYYASCDTTAPLTYLSMLRALKEQPPSMKKSSPQATCAVCGDEVCGRVLRYFHRLWRCMWISEFVLLIRDSTFDMRRILYASSKVRAQQVSRHLAKEQGLVEDTFRDFDTIVSDDAKRQREASSAAAKSLNDDLDQEGDDLAAVDRRVEQKFVMKLKPKDFQTEFRRRRQRVEKGYAGTVSYHSKLRAEMELMSIEDELGWTEYAHLMEYGARMLAQEKMGRLAVELIESSLLALRFSRAQVNGEYTKGRAMFKARLSRLSLRLSLDGQLMRMALSRVRLKFLLPVIRMLLKKSNGQKTSPNDEMIFGECLALYGSLLFTEHFAHHAVKSISASPERDIISFNRAWCTRHLMEFPHSFGLTMMAAHYCLLSMRWPYAVAEYIRALHMKPSNSVASLCLTTCSLGFSTSRGVQDRHQVVLRGFALLKRHERLRKENRRNLISQLQQWSIEKARRIIRSGQLDHGKSFFDHLQGALLREGFQIPEDGPITKEWLADSLASCLNATISDMVQLIGRYFEAERKYNQSRAYHQLALEHLAITGYQEALDLIGKSKAKSEGLLSLLAAQCELLLTSRFRTPSAMAITLKWALSDFPPAGVDFHLQLPMRHGHLRDIPAGSLGLHLLMAKTSSKVYDQIHDRVHRSKKLKDRPLVGTTQGLWGIEVPPSAGGGDKEGLFRPSAEAARLTVLAEKQAAIILGAYLDDLPPGSMMLGIDLEQLRFSAAHNAAAIHMMHDSAGVARELHRDTIVWKDV